MIASTRAELLRLFKWPVTWVLIGVWLTLTLMFGYIFDYLSYRDAVSNGNDRLAETMLSQLSLTDVPSTIVAGLPMFGGALMLILAALVTGSGYGWGTWKTLFTTGPGRLTTLGGTLLALVVVFAITAV
ncbi:MAG: ABC transporter permease, partial [Propionibacteriales bacterium]|nr:ABC transporter permease [Propionibacteriales bacterium]